MVNDWEDSAPIILDVISGRLYRLCPACTTFLQSFATPPCQPIELESCSNQQRIRQVFWLRLKKYFFWFGFGILCGGRY